jgi:Zn-dependent peptidase ImmA (M78 family)/DNA-binding XRE family transcriptional regulator
MKIKTLKPEFNFKMITLARESRALSQKELADAIGTDQGTISKLENGLLTPGNEVVKKISSTTEYPMNFFKQEEKIYDLSNFYYRKKLHVPQKEIIKSEAEINVTRMNIEKLMKSVEIPEPNYPKFDLDKDGTPTDFARYTREFWKLPAGRIENLTKLLEDNGIMVVNMDFKDSEIDGVPVITDNNTPIIFMNNSIPADRYRLTLAHEFGHLVMHVRKKLIDVRDTEEEAFLFGAELMMPEKEIAPQLSGKLTLEKLAELKKYWKISMGALIKRAMVLGLLTTNQYQNLWKKMSSYGYKLREPEELDFPKEQPLLLREVIDAHIEELMYTETELSQLLCLTSADMGKRYFPYRSRLKIVKKPLR